MTSTVALTPTNTPFSGNSNRSSMAEWSQLPIELLDQIYKRLQTQIDNLRFRSVCSSWRSSASPKPRLVPCRFPILPNDGISDRQWGFYLAKRTLFRLSLPHLNSDAWLVMLEEDTTKTLRLLNPLSTAKIYPLPTSFPNPLHLLNFRVSELGQEYVLQYVANQVSLGVVSNLYMEKVVLSWKTNHDFVLLTIHVSGKLATFKSGDNNWTVIDDMPSPYDDVVFFRDHFYAVDNTGRTVIVDPTRSALTLIAHSVFGGDKKLLVESEGELLLVDKYLSMITEEDLGDGDLVYADDEFNENGNGYISERTVRFKVFRLDRSGMNWVEVKCLGDRVLFLGDNCSFSASASDFPGCRGNCIYFTDMFFYASMEEDGVFKDHDIGLFDLENGSIGPLANFPDCSKLFWPPPSWVTSTISEEVGNHFEDLSS